MTTPNPGVEWDATNRGDICGCTWPHTPDVPEDIAALFKDPKFVEFLHDRLGPGGKGHWTARRVRVKDRKTGPRIEVAYVIE